MLAGMGGVGWTFWRFAIQAKLQPSMPAEVIFSQEGVGIEI